MSENATDFDNSVNKAVEFVQDTVSHSVQCTARLSHVTADIVLKSVRIYMLLLEVKDSDERLIMMFITSS